MSDLKLFGFFESKNPQYVMLNIGTKLNTSSEKISYGWKNQLKVCSMDVFKKYVANCKALGVTDYLQPVSISMNFDGYIEEVKPLIDNK